MTIFLDKIIITLVGQYQRHLSPRKGFSCAYRVLHHDLSCSAYFQQQVQTVGAWQAVPQLRSRLKACKAAALTLQNQDEDRRRKRRWRDPHWTDNCYYWDCDCRPPRSCDQDMDGTWDCCESDWGGFDCCDGSDCGSCDFF